MQPYYQLRKVFNCLFKRHFYSYRPNIGNFDEYFTTHISNFRESLSKRQCCINSDKLFKGYKDYVKVVSDLKMLTSERTAIAEQMKTLVKQTEIVSDHQDDLKAKGKLMREKMKELKDVENELDVELLPLLQTLPALLSPNTPQEDRILYESGSLGAGTNHIEMCGGDIKFRKHPLGSEKSLTVAYLMGNLATLENKLHDRLLDWLNGIEAYRRIIHPDTVKEFVADSCLEDDDKAIKVLQAKTGDEDEDSSHHLVLTGSSLPGFISYISTFDLQKVDWPLKLFSFGRNYKAGTARNSNHGLYDLSQAIQAEMFSAATDPMTSEALFDEQKMLVRSLYENLGLPFKVVEVAAKNLSSNESQRTDFYLWSPGFNQYFKCGHVRSLGDHVSRKLSFRSQPGGNFLNMNHGVVFKLPTVVASFIESEQTKTS